MLTNFLTNIGITRDWAGWFWGRLTAGATILMALYALNGANTFSGYLSTQHLKWLIVAAVVVLWLAGKYDSSELPAAPMKTSNGAPPIGAWLLPLLLVAGIGVVASGCASSQAVHLATSADTAIATALHQVYLDEEQAYAAGLFSQAKRDGYLKTIQDADRDALALTDSIDAWRAAGGNPTTVPTLVSQAKQALQQIVSDLGAGAAGSAFVKSLNAVIALLG